MRRAFEGTQLFCVPRDQKKWRVPRPLKPCVVEYDPPLRMGPEPLELTLDTRYLYRTRRGRFYTWRTSQRKDGYMAYTAPKRHSVIRSDHA